MKKWKCTVCDHIHEGDAPPKRCPVCGEGPEAFEKI
ncbi:MAG: rubredoxin [Magnetococcales bacterium]|nr:rubredoxin [Magnetococcales bacterium]MBF0148890.1 rubredoxin [Magnetococcales bacterium]MBF0347338.1 rubredoxin [Magnetococcales bacterium]MBF0630091.1 rubredoxin [Magnetococcales bacterium]